MIGKKMITLTLPEEMVKYLVAIVAKRPIEEGLQVFAELQKQCVPTQAEPNE